MDTFAVAVLLMLYIVFSEKERNDGTTCREGRPQWPRNMRYSPGQKRGTTMAMAVVPSGEIPTLINTRFTIPYLIVYIPSSDMKAEILI